MSTSPPPAPVQPAPTQPPPPQQPPAAPDAQAQQQAALATLTVILLAGLPPATVAAFAAAVLAPLGIDAAAVTTIIALLGPHANAKADRPSGPAQAWVASTNPVRRAAYLLAASKRQVVTDLLIERRYLGQHLSAERARLEAAGKADTIAGLVGTTLGWYATMDTVTTSGCREMNGRNFDVRQPPVVEGTPAYPGSVHPACRCLPGPPHPG